MRIRISSGGRSLRDWYDIDLSTALDGLPDRGEHVDRIFVDRAFEHVDSDLLPHLLAMWREHPHVTIRTMMAVVGHDPARARRLLVRDLITQDEFDRANAGAGPHQNSGVSLYSALRDAGWGVALPYNIRLLVPDNWPVTDLSPCQFGALCRALK